MREIRQNISQPNRMISFLRIEIGSLEEEIRQLSYAENQAFTSLESSKEPIRKTIIEYEEIIEQLKPEKPND